MKDLFHSLEEDFYMRGLKEKLGGLKEESRSGLSGLT